MAPAPPVLGDADADEEENKAPGAADDDDEDAKDEDEVCPWPTIVIISLIPRRERLLVSPSRLSRSVASSGKEADVSPSAPPPPPTPTPMLFRRLRVPVPVPVLPDALLTVRSLSRSPIEGERGVRRGEPLLRGEDDRWELPVLGTGICSMLRLDAA